MIKQFYPYKFSSLLFFGDILDDAKNFGWRKCRKYQSWDDLHIYEDDGQILSEAGDSLVNEQDLDPDCLERLYEIWLKASTYNPNTQDFDKPQKIRQQWEKFADSIPLCKQFPEYAYREISSFFSDGALKKMPNNWAKLLCCMLKFQKLIVDLREGFLPGLDLREFYESENHSEYLNNWITEVYDEVEYEMPDTDCHFLTFKNLLNNFGFQGEPEDFFADEGYKFNPEEGQSFTPPATIQYVNGGGDFLFRIIGQGALEIIEIDQQHPYIEQLSNSEEAKDLFESFARAYFHAKGRCGNFSDNLFDDFNSYLSLKLRSDWRG
jgi:hypothetical protein